MARCLLTPACTLSVVMIGVLFSPLQAQTELGWQTLPDSPATSRHNDVYFVTPEVGWIVNGAGEIFKTEDGGASWREQFSNITTHFRSVGFVDELRGFAGNVGLGEFGTTDPIVLRQTSDGGATWTAVESFEGPNPVGICGMNVVNDSMVVAVGRVRGPSVFVKTTDRGATWTSKSMSAYAAGLIDVHFFDENTGFAVGLSNADHTRSSGVILFTSDGGETWEKRFTTTRTGEWFWKLSFPSRQVGYTSLQRNSGAPIYFVKTTDGGETWEEKIFSGSYYFVQGIGFIDENVGWIGGNSSFPSFETKDGGKTWDSANFGSRMNRIRFFGDTLAYAVGRRVYKYRRESQVDPNVPEIPSQVTLQQNHPNPFSETTTIRYALGEAARVTVTIFDAAGRPLRTFANTQLAGSHSVVWDGRDENGREVASGPYLYEVRAGRTSKTLTMMLLR